MSQQQRSGWRLKRELTVGTLVQLIGVLLMVALAWANLQSELAIIQHDLGRLLESSDRMQVRIERLSDQVREQEYRLVRLEEGS